MDKDIRLVREHYAAIRDLITQNAGGWNDAATRARVRVLCASANAALEDFECRQRFRSIERHAGELYSADQHRKWDRRHMSGAEYLRLQILIALETVNTRLFSLDTLRERASRTGGAAAPQPPSI